MIKRVTKVFDGSMLNKLKKEIEPVTTFFSKKKDDKKSGVYLPQVAVAVKMHEHNRNDLINRIAKREQLVQDLNDSDFE